MGLFSWLKGEKKPSDVREPEEYEIVRLLGSYEVTSEDLSLSSIQANAEALELYLEDVLNLLGNKTFDLRILNAILTKLSVIIKNGLELNNLLTYLQDSYYKNVLEILNKVFDIKASESVEKRLKSLEIHRDGINKLRFGLNSLIAYSSLSKVEDVQEIQKELKRIIKETSLIQDLRDIKLYIKEYILSAEEGLYQNVNPKILEVMGHVIYSEDAR
jgi:hypothetical protein